MFKGFREFAMRGNIIDLAVAVIIGAAFTKVVNSLVEDIIMPPIGLLLGRVDFSNLFIVLKGGAKAAGAVTLNYGVFISGVLTFLIVAFVVYLLVRSVTEMGLRHDPAAAPATKPCPYCLSKIPAQATKCAYCTADLGRG
jgi:large conductance mechanosensitive channel